MTYTSFRGELNGKRSHQALVPRILIVPTPLPPRLLHLRGYPYSFSCFGIGQRSPARSSEVRRTPRLTPQEPQQRGYHSRNDDARDDREVEIESMVNDMNVAWQPAERNAREPMPSEADKNAKNANTD